MGIFFFSFVSFSFSLLYCCVEEFTPFENVNYLVLAFLSYLFVQISRSIGDAYLKNAEFNREPLLSRFRLPQPFHKSILSAEPSIVTHKLSPEDQFVILASDGLWEHLSNQEAVDIVNSSPRNVRLPCSTRSFLILIAYVMENFFLLILFILLLFCINMQQKNS